MEDVPLSVRQLRFGNDLTRYSCENGFVILAAGGAAVANIIHKVYRPLANFDFMSDEKNQDKIAMFAEEKGLSIVDEVNSKMVFKGGDITVNYVMLKDDGYYYSFTTEHYFNDMHIGKQFFKPYDGYVEIANKGSKTEHLACTTLSPTMVYLSKTRNNVHSKKNDPTRRKDKVDIDMIKPFVDSDLIQEIMEENLTQ